MGKPRPSLTLIMDIDEALKTEELRLEVDRCYAYIAPTLIRTHAAEETPSNTLRFLVKLGNHKYLNSADEGADELWNEIMERWFSNAFYKVGNNLKLFNRRQKEIGNPELAFDKMEIELENGALLVDMRLDSNSSINAEDAAMLGVVREALNAGALTGAKKILMPSEESYIAQYEAGKAAKEAADAEKAAQEEAERLAREAEAAQAEQAAEDAFMESPELTEDEEEISAEELQKSIEEQFSFDEALFAVDYTMWEVQFEDGSAKIYDSATKAFTA